MAFNRHSRVARRYAATVGSGLPSPLAAAAILALAAVPAYGATLHWDGGIVNIGTDGNGASAGGDGTWNTAIQNWDKGAEPHVAWNNANGDTAVLGGTAGIVTLSAGIITGGVNIDTAGYTLRSSAGGIALSGPITLAGNTTFGAPTNNPGNQAFNEFTLNGAIGGTGNVTFNSTVTTNVISTVTLNAASTYVGNTFLDRGAGSNSATQIVLKLGVDNALPATTVVTINGQAGAGTGRVAEINLSGFDQTLAGLTNTPAGSRVQRVVNSDVSGAATLTIDGPTNTTFSGNLGTNSANFSVGGSASTGSTNGNNFSLTKNGTGTFTLSGANPFIGTTKVLGGILSLGNAAALSQSPLDTLGSVAGGATNGLRTTVTTVTLGGLTGDKNLSDVFTTTAGGYGNVTALTLNPVAGASHSYSGAIANGAAGMALIKSGAGVQAMNGPGNYTGATTVNAGTLLVNGSIGGTGVSVTNTGTLGGTGVINAGVTVSGTATLSPGASAESLSSGALTMAAGTTFLYEAANDGAAGADLMNVDGALSLTDVLLDLSGADLDAGTWAVGDKLTLISYEGTPITSGFTGYDDDTAYPFGGNSWTINYNDTAPGDNFFADATGTSFVTMTAVPEPAATGLVALAGCGMLGRRRRTPA